MRLNRGITPIPMAKRIVVVFSLTLGSIAIIIGGYTAYWFIASSTIEKRIIKWTATQKKTGLLFDVNVSEVRGYPLKFEVLFQQPEIQNVTDKWSWNADMLAASFRPWQFNKFKLVNSGHNTLRYFDGKIWQEYQGDIGNGTASLNIDQQQIEQFLINLNNITISKLSDNTTYLIESVQTQVEKFQNINSDEDIISKTFATAKMDIIGLQLPPNFGEEMGNTIEHLSFNVSIFGHIPTGDSDTPVQIWRDDGGTMEINSFHCRWGPLEIDTSGTVALDSEMSPIGSLTADIKGYGDVIDAMIMSNIIPLGDAFLAKVAFNMMAEKPEDGGPRVLRSIPIIAQDGNLFVGPVSVGELPVLSLK